jgi:hypothetical protein
MMQMTYKRPEEPEPEILKPGWYDFHVAHVYDKDHEGNPLVAKTGTPYLKLVCKESVTGIFIWHLIFLEEDNAKKISALIYACGIDLVEGQQVIITQTTFLEKSFRGKVDANPGFDGVQRNRIARVLRPSDAKEIPTLQPELEQEPGPDKHHDQGEDDLPF